MAESTTGDKPQSLRSFIIHGHFYQPPRENPWINIIETQPSAAPAHDWNERVFDECYRPNAFSRLLDSQGMITGIHNNYAAMSFNFGPTLFRWLEDAHPEVVQRIVEADRESRVRLGFGNALAQAYNHIILPLASARDQRTQIKWAKEFFRSRFEREPDGMWLSETAINMETVRTLIEEQISFVVLSPTQAEAFRLLEQDCEWVDVSNNSIDTRRVYRVFPRDQKGNRQEGFLDVFFFDEGLSRGVSFEGVLTDAAILGNRIRDCFDSEHGDDQVVTIATDGETFGHHKPFGDMCLAYLFAHAAAGLGMKPVNFAWFRQQHPARYEVALKNELGEGCAWSCAHGTGRWIRDCGCQTGGPDWWNQQWRTPLRDALNELQKRIDQAFEERITALGGSPWKLRDASAGRDYAWDSQEFAALLETCGLESPLEKDQMRRIARLLQAQKYVLFAFTSCGWFFADISGIEPMQNLAYAGRALQLGLEGDQRDRALEEFTKTLESARSNIGGQTGRSLFEKHIRRSLDHLPITCFNAAAERIIGRGKARAFNVFGYTVRLAEWPGTRSQRKQVTVFEAEIDNPVTAENSEFLLLVHHRDGAEMNGIIVPRRPDLNREALDSHDRQIWQTLPDAVELWLSDIYYESRLHLADYFIARIARRTTETYRSWMQRNALVIDSLAMLNNRLPAYLHGPVAYLLTSHWNETIGELQALGQEERVFQELLETWKRARRYGVTIDFTFSVDLVQKLLIEGLRALEAELSAQTAERLRWLLNLAERFEIPVKKSLLEDEFFSVFTGNIRQLYDEIRDNENRDQDRWSLLIQMVGFARRMNFNTDCFPVL